MGGGGEEGGMERQVKRQDVCARGEHPELPSVEFIPLLCTEMGRLLGLGALRAARLLLTDLPTTRCFTCTLLLTTYDSTFGRVTQYLPVTTTYCDYLLHTTYGLSTRLLLIAYYLPRTSQYLPSSKRPLNALTTHCCSLLLTTHCSLLTAHHSLLTTHCSLLAT